MHMGAASHERRLLLREVASRVPTPGDGRSVRVAVDGVDGVGKTTFAAELTTALRDLGRQPIQVSVDGFHHPRAVRYRRGRDSPAGFWLDSYDYEALAENVLEPFEPEGSRRYRTAVRDVHTDRALDVGSCVAPVGAVLIVEGLFLHRDELSGVWDFSVFVHAPFEVTVKRLADRDGTHRDVDHPSLARYVQGQRLYFEACRPWLRADVVVDNTDLRRPRIARETEF